MTNLPRRIHVIGICGVAMSALAIAFHKKGVKVTGSDKGFFPPVSTELEKHGISFYAGWHPDKMIEGGAPEIVIVGTASGSQNPETAYAKEQSIPLFSYPEVIGEYFAKKTSVVCAGTWGKTSSSALLSYIMEQAGMDPSYMFGGISLSHDSSARLGDSDMSVFEGDEYKSSPTDPRAKFFHYKATNLLLTAVSWDHADLYPTEKEYFAAFDKLIATIPSSGFIVGCADNTGVEKVLASYAGTRISYGKGAGNAADFTYEQVQETRDGIDFTITNKGNSHKIHSPLLGAYQAENVTGCFAMAASLGIQPTKIVEAIASFKGLKRRLEKRLDGTTNANGITIIDDIAHSPEKASAVLGTLRRIYDKKIIAVFEPNTGGRRREALAKYDHAFKDADMVIIPRLTKLKIGEDSADVPIESAELAEKISKTHPDAHCIDEDEKLVQFLADNTKAGDVIAFLGSHGFRGMIEGTIAQQNRN